MSFGQRSGLCSARVSSHMSTCALCVDLCLCFGVRHRVTGPLTFGSLSIIKALKAQTPACVPSICGGSSRAAGGAVGGSAAAPHQRLKNDKILPLPL